MRRVNRNQRLRARVVIVVLLAMLMTACSRGGVDASTVKKAIALQVGQVQTELTQQLYRTATKPPLVTVDNVQIDSQQSVTIVAQPAVRVRGTYDVTLDFTEHTLRQNRNIFDVYLQPTPDGQESWKLARPVPNADNQGKRWIMIPLASP
ncbi:MAG TPA: hypothetical protein ACFE0H_11995 [Elainellaceae cyanobacterium]